MADDSDDDDLDGVLEPTPLYDDVFGEPVGRTALRRKAVSA